jgi:hypothetical protein
VPLIPSGAAGLSRCHQSLLVLSIFFGAANPSQCH